MTDYDESNLSEAARRAYEYARSAFEGAPDVPAHGWRGTLEKRAAERNGAEEPDSEKRDAEEQGPERTDAVKRDVEGHDADGCAAKGHGAEKRHPDERTVKQQDGKRDERTAKSSRPASGRQSVHGHDIPTATLRERIAAARAKAAEANKRPDADSSAAPFARAESEDDDGYDPWSDRREEPGLFERDPWR